MYSDGYMKKNYALFGSYEIPFLSPRLRVKILAGYSQFDSTAAATSTTGLTFRGSGWFYGGAARYNILQVEDWLFDGLASFTHEESTVTPSLFSDFLEQKVSMNLFAIGAELHRSGDMADTAFGFMRVSTVGGGSSDDEFMLARTGAEREFSIWTLNAAHRQYLDEAKVHEVSGSFTNIMPDARLVPSKMTTFGGLYSVRGYKEDEIVADGGILASFQYKFDLTNYIDKKHSVEGQEKEPVSYKNKAMWPPDFSFLAFTDYGRAKMRHPVSGELSIETLLGAGLGIGVDMGNNFSARIYYSWPLLDLEGDGKTKSGDAGVWNFNFVYRW